MTQPPYGQDPQNPYGQNPYDPPAQPYGAPQPPKKSRTALIGLVVLAVLLIAGGALAVVLAVSSDSDNDKAGEKASESTSAPTGERVQGTGYSFTIPEDWKDTTDETTGLPDSVDVVVVWGEKLEGGRANVIVETGPAGGASDPEALREQWQTNMTGSSGATPEKLAGTTIAGADAIGTRIERTNEKGVAIVQIAYLLIREGNVYSIALSGKAGDDDAEAAFQSIRDSWTWE
jgi:hypothetical protein